MTDRSDTSSPSREECGAQAAALFQGILNFDEIAEQDLYRYVGLCVRQKAIGRHSDLDDDHHDVFIDVLIAIREEKIRDPASLLGFVKVVATRKACWRIEKLQKARREIDDGSSIGLPDKSTPETVASTREALAFLFKGLRRLPARNTELLTRFYFEGESREQIMEIMDLSETAFRLGKWRAKQKLTSIVASLIDGSSAECRDRTSNHILPSIAVRTFQTVSERSGRTNWSFAD